MLLGWLGQEEVCDIDFENFGFLLELHIERRALVFLPTQAQPSKLDRLLNRPSKGSLGGDESWASSLTARVVLPERQPHATQGEHVIKAFSHQGNLVATLHQFTFPPVTSLFSEETYPLSKD